MARIAVSILGSKELSAEVFRAAVAALAVRIDLMGVGPIVRSGDRAGIATVARVEATPKDLSEMLERLGGQGEVCYDLMAYGSMVYRSEDIKVPPEDMEHLRVALESLASVDPDFEIPELGNVVSHLGLVRDRR